MIESYWNGKVFLASERKYTNTNVYVATIGTCLLDPLQERLTQVHSHLPVPASTPLEHYHIGALKLSFPVLFPDSHWPILVGCSTTLIALGFEDVPQAFLKRCLTPFPSETRLAQSSLFPHYLSQLLCLHQNLKALLASCFFLPFVTHGYFPSKCLAHLFPSWHLLFGGLKRIHSILKSIFIFTIISITSLKPFQSSKQWNKNNIISMKKNL